MAKTVKIAQTSELSPGTGKVAQAEGRSIALFNVEGMRRTWLCLATDKP